MSCSTFVPRVALAWLACAILAAPACRAQSERRVGDFLSIAMPLATLGTELLRREYEGASEYAQAFVAGAGATEVLQRSTHVERPDHSNDHGFPSGHAARAFSSAFYVHRRYGMEYAWPLYGAALLVGHSRVAAHRHRWSAVAGSAVVTGAATWMLVEPRGANGGVALLPLVGPRSLGLELSAAW